MKDCPHCENGIVEGVEGGVGHTGTWSRDVDSECIECGGTGEIDDGMTDQPEQPEGYESAREADPKVVDLLRLSEEALAAAALGDMEQRCLAGDQQLEHFRSEKARLEGEVERLREENAKLKGLGQAAIAKIHAQHEQEMIDLLNKRNGVQP